VHDDLLVVGFDLAARREVHVAEQSAAHWRQLGYGAAETLVCFYCFHGFEAPAGTRVPLVTRGRVGGQVRTHFAHPSGRAPVGGHNPETIWHLTAKHTLARWAAARPEVQMVRVEQWTDDQQRRADVAVRLRDGSRLALEAQRLLMTDDHWRARHRDYAVNRIQDVWFWHPQVHIPYVTLEERVPIWLFNPAKGTVEALLGQPHLRLGRRWWASKDLSQYALHYPPCPGDGVERRRLLFSDLHLDAAGVVLPEQVHAELEQARQRVVAAARADRDGEQRRAVDRGQAGRRPAVAPARRPEPRPASGGPQDPVCSVCHQRLDPVLAKAGRHVLC
jgi:hypothetical protein